MFGHSKRSIPTLGREEVPSTAGLAALVDVETTGLSSRTDRIVEFAGVLFAYHRQSGEVVGRVYEYASLNDPGITIPRAAIAVHGITQKMVKRHRMNIATIDALLTDAEFIVAHNASFDRGFLAPISDVARSKTWLCSMRHINWNASGHSSRALQKLLLSHSIRPQNAHRALDDVRCTLSLLTMSDVNGYPYLRQLLPKEPNHQIADEEKPPGERDGENAHGTIREKRAVKNEWTVKRH